ncbi:hypothetical protein [Aeromonas veronii]
MSDKQKAPKTPSQSNDKHYQPNSKEQRGGYQPPSGTGSGPTSPPGKK